MTAATSVTGRPGGAQRPRRAAGGDQLEAEANQAGPEFGQAGLVGDREQRPARDRHPGGSLRGVDANGSTVGLDRERAGQEQADGARQQPVLDRVDALEERFFGVAGQDRDGLLGDDRAAVERVVDEVDRNARDLDSCGERVAHAVRTGERRQQRRVEVDHPARERGQHRRPRDPHVARQNDQLRRDGRDRLGEDAVFGGPGGVIAPWRRRHEQRLDPLLHGPVQGGTRTIGEDQGYLRVERAARHHGVQGTQVAAGSRNANRDPMRHAAPPPYRFVRTPNSAPRGRL